MNNYNPCIYVMNPVDGSLRVLEHHTQVKGHEERHCYAFPPYNPNVYTRVYPESKHLSLHNFMGDPNEYVSHGSGELVFVPADKRGQALVAYPSELPR